MLTLILASAALWTSAASLIVVGLCRGAAQSDS